MSVSNRMARRLRPPCRRGNFPRRGLAALVAALWIPVLVLIPIAPAGAQGLDLSTPFPAVVVGVGERVSLDVNVHNGFGTDQTVDLAVVQAPEGWQVDLRGRGRSVRAVHVPAGEDTSVDLEIQVPSDISSGETYEVAIQGRSAQGADRLNLRLEIGESGSAASLEPEFPDVQGASGADFEFRLTLENATGEDQLFAFAAEAPEGWTVRFQPAFEDRDVTSIPVEAGGSENVDVLITPPEAVEAGDYTIPVTASAGEVAASTELTVRVIGTFAMTVRTQDERLSFEAAAGRPTELVLVVENTGTAELRDVNLSASPPVGWEVEFEPAVVGNLPAGETQEVRMRVTPREEAIAGDYQLRVNANSPAVSESVDFRVTLRTSTLWGWVGFLLVAAALVGTFSVFRIYGRR